MACRRAVGETAPTPQEMPHRIEAALRKAQQNTTGEIQHLQEEVTYAQQQEKKAQNEVLHLKKEVENLETRAKGVEADCASQIKEMALAGFQQKAEHERKLRDGLNTLETQLQEAQQRADDATTLYEGAKVEKTQLEQRCKRIQDALDLTRKEADGTRAQFRELTDRLVEEGDLSAEERIEKWRNIALEREKEKEVVVSELTEKLGAAEVKLAEETSYAKKLQLQLQEKMHTHHQQQHDGGAIVEKDSEHAKQGEPSQQQASHASNWDVFDSQPNHAKQYQGASPHAPHSPAWGRIKQRVVDHAFTHTGMIPRLAIQFYVMTCAFASIFNPHPKLHRNRNRTSHGKEENGTRGCPGSRSDDTRQTCTRAGEASAS